MKILYVHGFGSKFDASNDKVVALRALGEVVGITVDYTEARDEIATQLVEYVLQHEIDLIVGTSMGGHMSAIVGARVGVPFVAINPALDPATSLYRHIGKHTTYAGDEYELTEEAITSYDKFDTTGCGLVLLDSGDALFDSAVTAELLTPHYEVVTFDGGSHRFEHMNEALDVVMKHCETSGVVYG